MPDIETETCEWVSRSVALQMLGCSLTAFTRLVREGQIRKRHYSLRRYWREDIERLAAPPKSA